MPNATGNLSFSLIGIDGQPSACLCRHFVSDGRRRILVQQRRNLSDNLLFKKKRDSATTVHNFDFTMLAISGGHGPDRVGVLRGWIFVHEGSTIDDLLSDGHQIDIRAERSNAAATARFAVSFRLYRTGRLELRAPTQFGLRDVRFGHQEKLLPDEALQPLVAQCFYFLRDITHRHQHHSNQSDTLTTVWPAQDRSLWIRETLYELHRRVLMLRRQRSPRGQEDALGILAYVSAFESAIAEPFRKQREKSITIGFVPSYEKGALRESLNANLETKRRKRIQRNVAAAVIPAFAAAMLNLANSIYGKNATYVPTISIEDSISALFTHPMTTVLGTLSQSEWIFPALIVAGFFWVVAFAGITQPSERAYLKGVAQAAAVWGPIRAALSMALVAVVLISLIIYLLQL